MNSILYIKYKPSYGVSKEAYSALSVSHQDPLCQSLPSPVARPAWSFYFLLYFSLQKITKKTQDHVYSKSYNRLLYYIPAGLGEFAVDDLGVFMPFICTDPHLKNLLICRTIISTRNQAHLSERAQACENTAANPCGVLALSRCRNPNLHFFDCDSLNLAHEAIREVLAERSATRKDDVEVQGFSEIEISACDGILHNLVNTGVFEANNLRVKQDFGGTVTFLADLGGMLVGFIPS